MLCQVLMVDRRKEGWVVREDLTTPDVPPASAVNRLVAKRIQRLQCERVQSHPCFVERSCRHEERPKSRRSVLLCAEVHGELAV